jgi:Family of unknown function (DUF6159)
MSAPASGGDAPTEGRIARSWRLSRIAWDLVRSDRAILTLALLSTLITAAAMAVIYDLTGVFSGHRHASGGRFALVTLVLAFPLTFIAVYFNTAIAAAAAAVLDGRRLTLRQALAVPSRRLGQVALWSLLASGVGVILEQIASRLPLIGSIAVRLFGLTWSLASMFAVPILAVEGCAATTCLKRSAQLVKKRWGEGISGNVTITAWTVLAILPVTFILGVGIAATRNSATARVTLIAIAALAAVVVAAAGGIVRQTFAVVLYRYATTGHPAGGFSAGDLQAPFTKGGLKPWRDSATPRRQVDRTSVLLWLVSAALGAALAVLFELGKRHYAAHHLSGRIFAAVIFAAFFMLVIRVLLGGARRLI